MGDQPILCTECGWYGDTEDMLVEAHPFQKGYTCYGCPSCREIETVVARCDEPGCKDIVACGTPVIGGYRSTCSKHAPKTSRRKPMKERRPTTDLTGYELAVVIGIAAVIVAVIVTVLK